MAKQDLLQQAREQYADAQESVREQNARFREDLKFSNPSCPEQWDSYAVKARTGRPMLTLDRTNQFISQIVNDARQNKPSIQVLPADSQADPAVAEKLNGIIRHIEYTSRAGIAYDMAIELAARVGQGWLRVVPKVVRPETNEQEIIIQRVHDPMSICLDPNHVEPDGSDAMWGFAETTLTDKAFERAYPKAKKAAWDSEGWFSTDGVRIAEYFKVVETREKRHAIPGPDGGMMTVNEEEYWKLAQQIGYAPPVDEKNSFTAVKRTVKWCKLSGVEVLEETTFPSTWIPLVPVLGYELWVEGKRYVCGMVRRLMDGQRLHNYEMSALTETLMSQPKAPFIMSERAVDGHEDKWQALNQGNPAFVTYNDLDEQGPINSPTRLQPPQFPTAYANGAQLAISEMEASVGMYKSNLGQQSNAVSGRAKLADQREGDTANYHYVDNRNRGIAHLGRIIVSMIPIVIDTRRQAKLLGEDGEQDQVEVNPDGPAVQKQGKKVISINPNVGAYDVRVKAGPSFSSMREETARRLTDLTVGNPMLASALAPLIIKMNDMPEAEKISRVAISLLPPEVQKVYSEDESDDIPPAVKAEMEAQGQQIQQMAGAMDQASNVIKDLQEQLDTKNTAAQDQVKIAMSQINEAKAGLQAQSDQIAADKAALAQSVRIAELELELKALQATNAGRAEVEATRTAAAPAAAPAAPQPMVITMPAQDNAMKEMATNLAQQLADMAAEVRKGNDTVSQLQVMTLEALEDVTDAVSAPKQITIKRDKSGKAVGATSTPMLTDIAESQ